MKNFLIITVIFTSATSFANESLNKLENSYISKAETIETEKQAALKEADAKVATLLKKLDAVYLSSLGYCGP